MAQDFYVVLGLSRDADLNQIRRAYRQLVKRCHPDIDRGTQAVERFLEVQRAYETLSDERSRAEYDTAAHAGPAGVPVPVRQPPRAAACPPAWRGSPRGREELLVDAIDEALGGFVPGIFTRGRGASSRKDLYVELVLEPQEAATGGLYPLRVPVRFGCPACGGTGARGPFLCPSCKGSTLGVHDLQISMPPGVSDGTRATLSLADIGLPNVCLNVLVSVRA